MFNIVLFQPDIALNVGAAIRLSACFSCKLHIIEPCGFPYDVKKIKQAALDYLDKVEIIRHTSFAAFLDYVKNNPGNISLLTTKTEQPYYEHSFKPGDYLLFGSESAGVNREVREKISNHLKIPLNSECRSLNLSTSIALILGEALRQNKFFSFK